MAFIYPVDNAITQYFGANPYSPTQPWGHYGVDFGCPIGTPVRAIGNGTIRFADWNQNLGGNPWMVIPGATGSGIFVALELDEGGFTVLECHLSRTDLNPGDRVRAGDIIGYSGSTGNSTGPHLHQELIYMPNVNGYMYGRVDSLKYMNKTALAGNVTLAANQRLVGGSNLSQRDKPATSGTVVRTVPAGTVEVFDGYAIGEEVSLSGVTSNIWYKDSQGYVWAGGFTEQKTAGLADLTPLPALNANQRMVGDAAANQRATPTVDGKIVRVAGANTVEEFTGYVIGDAIENNNIWFKDTIGYIWSGLFTDTSTNGLANQTAEVVSSKPNQRIAGPGGAIQRSIADPGGENVRTIPGNTLEEFTHFVHGAMVDLGGVRTDLWYKDSQGYVWAGAFTEQKTDGLTDATPITKAPEVTPVPTPPNGNKTIGSSVTNLRENPFVDALVLKTLPADSVVAIDGYVDGDSLGATTIWFKVTGGGYIHASTVTDNSVTGFTKLESPVRPEPLEPPYEFEPDFDFVEYQPADTTNMQNGNFPSKPTHVVLHQFDARSINPTIAGVINHFQTVRPGKESSAHFAVSEDRVVQLVSLKDRAFHAGKVGNDYIGIEVDPDQDTKTVKSVKKLLTAIREKFGYLPIYTEHKDVPGNNTSCGADIDLELYRLDDSTPTPTPNPTPETPPVNPGQPTEIDAATKKAIISEFLDSVMDDYVR